MRVDNLKNWWKQFDCLCYSGHGLKDNFACLIFAVGGQTLKHAKFMLLENVVLYDSHFSVEQDFLIPVYYANQCELHVALGYVEQTRSTAGEHVTGECWTTECKHVGHYSSTVLPFLM